MTARARVLMLILAALTLGDRAHAQPVDERRVAEASMAAERGKELFAAGKYAEAAKAFEAADELLANAVAKQNAGAAWERAGENARAADAYEAALAMGTLDGEFTADTRARVAKLEPRLAVLVVAEPRGGWIRVAHVQRRAIPTRVHLDPGNHAVEVTTPRGVVHRRSIEAREGAIVDLRVPGNEPEPPEAARSVPEPRHPDPPNLQKTLGFVALGVGGATGIASVVCGVRYVTARDEFLASSASRTDGGLHDEAAAWQTATAATFYAALGVAAVGVLLLATAGDDAAVRGAFGVRARPASRAPGRFPAHGLIQW